MILPLWFKSDTFNPADVDAVPQSVRNGKVFLGSGSDEKQTGELSEVPAATYQLGLNGRQEIPAGIHNGNVTVKQTGIAMMDATTIYPTDQSQTVKTASKYMGGELSIAALYGLTPENIKKDVTILGVTGTFEGYN